MSLQNCQSGTTTGFPVTLSQNLFSTWPGTTGVNSIQKLVSPIDFTVQWGPATQVAAVSVKQNTSVFQISGLDVISSGTTLTYGDATYSCSPILSILQNQHRSFSQSSEAKYEMILAFQIKNKSMNPSSPDVILMCRPLIFTTGTTSPFWTAVNDATKTGKPKGVSSFDMSTLFAYSPSQLMPMITYSTCIPVKLLNYATSVSSQLGSINCRVHVVTQAMHITADPGGTGVCSSINKYTLALPGSPTSLFSGAAASSVFQFQDGLGDDTFPSGTKPNLIPLAPNTVISDFQVVLQTFEYLIPKQFLGKSLAEIAEAEAPIPKAAPKKSFKCYRLDPEKDIKGDQILIDPTTGESLTDTMRQKAYEDSGGDPAYLDLSVNGPDTSGIMPGDIQNALSILFIILMTLFLLGYLSYIAKLGFWDKQPVHALIHFILGFGGGLTGLVFFGRYYGNQEEDTTTATRGSARGKR